MWLNKAIARYFNLRKQIPLKNVTVHFDAACAAVWKDEGFTCHRGSLHLLCFGSVCKIDESWLMGEIDWRSVWGEKLGIFLAENTYTNI